MKTEKLEKFQQEIAGLSIEELKKKRRTINIVSNCSLYLGMLLWPIIAYFLLIATISKMVSEGVSVSVESALFYFVLAELLSIIPIKIYIRKRNLVWEIDARLNQLGTNL